MATTTTTITVNSPEGGELEPIPVGSTRADRNRAEKLRRDKLNTFITELSSLVPALVSSTKRMDKTSVLRLAANYLRINISLKPDEEEASTSTSSNYIAPGLEHKELSSILLDTMEGFMLIVTTSGRIVFVSDTIKKLLGHDQVDLMGHSLYSLCHEGDVELLRHHLQPSKPFESKDAETSSSSSSTSLECVPRSPSFYGGKPEEAMSGLSSGERRSFYIRLAEKMTMKGDPTQHTTVHLNGVLRPPTKKWRNKLKKDSSTGSADEHLLVCVARPMKTKGIKELSLMEAIQDEYITRHQPDGRIIYTDHRIAFVAGYLTEEVMGLSAFHFIHQDDLPCATIANRQMFSSVEGQGFSVYRLRSKTGTLIYLKTRGYLEFNKTTQKVESFVCINTLLSSEEGDKELEKERERITPFITFQTVTTATTSTNGSKALAITQSGESSNGHESKCVQSTSRLKRSYIEEISTEGASGAKRSVSTSLIPSASKLTPNAPRGSFSVKRKGESYTIDQSNHNGSK